RLRRFVHPDHLASVDGLLDSRAGKSQMVLVADDGATLPVSLAASKFSIDNVPVTCVVVSDLTEEKAQDERKTLLRQETAARAVAEQENRTKDEFLALVSHELRTP